MKQKLLLLAMALLGLSGTAMADGITFSGDIQEGKFGLLTIYSTVESIHYNGFEIHITEASLKGITIESVVPTNELKETYPDIQIQHSLNTDGGYYVVMGMTMESATEYLPIGTEIPIVKVYLKADNSFNVGDKVNLEINHGEFSQVGESQSVHFIGKEFGKEDVTVPLEVVKEYTAERTIDAEGNYEIEDSYGGYAENITVIRNIKAGKWSTLCLPFNMSRAQVTAAFPNSQLVTFNPNFEYTPEEKLIEFSFTPSKSLAANKLYFIKTKSDVESFKVDGVVVSKTDVVTSTTYEGEDDDYIIKGIGVYKPQAIPKNGVFINDNKFYYSTGTSNVKTTRGYLVLDDYFFSEDGAGANIIFTIDDEPTAIEGLSTTNYRPNDAVYSISGVYMGKASDMKKLPRGMYIVNNKKITVK